MLSAYILSFCSFSFTASRVDIFSNLNVSIALLNPCSGVSLFPLISSICVPLNIESKTDWVEYLFISFIILSPSNAWLPGSFFKTSGFKLYCASGVKEYLVLSSKSFFKSVPFILLYASSTPSDACRIWIPPAAPAIIPPIVLSIFSCEDIIFENSPSFLSVPNCWFKTSPQVWIYSCAASPAPDVASPVAVAPIPVRIFLFPSASDNANASPSAFLPPSIPVILSNANLSNPSKAKLDANAPIVSGTEAPVPSWLFLILSSKSLFVCWETADKKPALFAILYNALPLSVTSSANCLFISATLFKFPASWYFFAFSISFPALVNLPNPTVISNIIGKLSATICGSLNTSHNALAYFPCLNSPVASPIALSASFLLYPTNLSILAWSEALFNNVLSPGVNISKIVSPRSTTVLAAPAWNASIILEEPLPYPWSLCSLALFASCSLANLLLAISSSDFPISNAWVLYISVYPSPKLLTSFMFSPNLLNPSSYVLSAILDFNPCHWFSQSSAPAKPFSLNISYPFLMYWFLYLSAALVSAIPVLYEYIGFPFSSTPSLSLSW